MANGIDAVDIYDSEGRLVAMIRIPDNDDRGITIKITDDRGNLLNRIRCDRQGIATAEYIAR